MYLAYKGRGVLKVGLRWPYNSYFITSWLNYKSPVFQISIFRFSDFRWCLFVLSFFPRDVLGEILNLTESVSEGFPTYSLISCR